VITLTATPDAGWSFAGWSGDSNSATNPVTVTMDSDKSITATFTQVNTPGVNVHPTTVDVEEGGATATYAMHLDSQPMAIVTIAIAADGQTTVEPVSLTFDAANWDTAQHVTVTAVDDTDVEGTHTSIIRHNATSADEGYDSIAITAVTAHVDDDDVAPAPVSIQFSSASYSVKETAGEVIVTVNLSGAATQPVTVTYTASDGTATNGSDYTAVQSTLSFEVGQTSQSFSVPILSDTELEGDETVNLTLSDPINAISGVPDTATLTIVDNAVHLPVITRNH
jgi:uncharacterized repeat protein (TIGR02543 family)